MNIKNLVLLTDYIILFPVKWYSFIHRVIARSTIYDNVIIIPRSFTLTCQEELFRIFELLKETQLVQDIKENIDFYIIYFEDVNKSKVFSTWLNLITLRACLEVFGEVRYSDVFKDQFEVTFDRHSVLVNTKCETRTAIKMALHNTDKVSSVVYNFNFFSFCEQLEKTYHLLS